VGCKAPEGAIFNEFRCWNDDENDTRFNTAKGMYETGCGFENVSLAWTGTEYMCFMLKHNEVDIPEEGLSILRYFSLKDWHTRNEYSTLTSLDDDDIQTFAADFDELRCNAKELHLKSIDFDNHNCDLLWDTHYSHIARKYGADGLLRW
jgi:inositol oxygenase